MINKNLTTETQIVEQRVTQWRDKLRLFVPVDFSPHSYQTLQYAMQIAKMCDGTLDLFHALRIKDIPNSESPLSIQYGLKKAESDAYTKLNSLKEITTEYGAVVSSCYVAIGDPQGSLKLRLSVCGSNLLVVSKRERISQWSALNLPILRVPAMVSPKPVSKVLMIRNGQPLQERVLQPLRDMLSHGENQVTVINCGPNARKMKYDYWLPLGNTKVNFTHKYELARNEESEIKRIVAKYAPEMICQVYKKSTWWEKLWGRSVNPELDVNIPTLVLFPL